MKDGADWPLNDNHSLLFVKETTAVMAKRSNHDPTVTTRASAATSTSPYVALLRGINVGGKNKLPMSDLASIFENACANGVQTYIQSGNVVFHAPAKDVAEISIRVCSAIERNFGFRAPVVVRSAAALRKVIVNNPFPRAAADPTTLHVAFLADEPSKAAVQSLDPQRSPGDSLRVIGSEVYLHLPNGVARTKLTNDYLDRSLQTTATMRNWRTVLAIAELLDAK